MIDLKRTQYGKTMNIFERDSDGKLTGQVARSELLLQMEDWIVSEKIDGTNVRIVFAPGEKPQLYGRTHASQLPAGLSEAVLGPISATTEELQAALKLPENAVVVLYGEAYGAGIQSGGGYRPDKTKAVRIFDARTYMLDEDGTGITTGGRWLELTDHADILDATGLKGVPMADHRMKITEIFNICLSEDRKSAVAKEESGAGIDFEGFILRAHPMLYTSRGERILFKMKVADAMAVAQIIRGK